MSRELTFQQCVERSIIKTYRKNLWNPFVEACKNYRLIDDGDRIAVTLDGTTDALAMVLCLRHLARTSATAFELAYDVTCDKEFYASLGFASSSIEDCNKRAVPTTLNDVVDTAIDHLFHHGEIRGILPKEKDGDTVIIRPLFCVYDSVITNFKAFNSLPTADRDIPEIRKTVEEIKRLNPDLEHNVFTSVHNVKLDTFVAYTQNGKRVSPLLKTE